MLFTESSGVPTVVTSPDWDCIGPFPDAGYWGVDCRPRLEPQLRAAPNFVCQDPMGTAGATPLTSGWASVRIGCHVTGQGAFWSTCTVTWPPPPGTGLCTARLPGTYDFTIMCRAQVTWTGLGLGFAECSTGA